MGYGKDLLAIVGATALVALGMFGLGRMLQFFSTLRSELDTLTYWKGSAKTELQLLWDQHNEIAAAWRKDSKEIWDVLDKLAKRGV